ncbi:MAG TPA: hypothetical protein VEA41_07935 [Salinarimonas sp.]|nr:hypothetical protein [Salinarimonas sp.]
MSDDFAPRYSEAEMADYRQFLAELYQVVGVLAHMSDTFDDPQVQRILDALSENKPPAESILPFDPQRATARNPLIPKE